MSIRVIAGKAKGRKLKLVPGDTTRPIMDKVKEALFSIIGRDILDASFLDLFAGTGSVGIEALSRGAGHALFIEIDKLAIRTVYDNLKSTGLEDHAVVRRVDALTLLKSTPPRIYDYIFIAPPQYKKLWLQTLQALDTHPKWLTPTTQVIVQIDPTEQQDISFQHLTTYDQRQYGKTLLWFLRGKPLEEASKVEEKTNPAIKPTPIDENSPQSDAQKQAQVTDNAPTPTATSPQSKPDESQTEVTPSQVEPVENSSPPAVTETQDVESKTEVSENLPTPNQTGTRPVTRPVVASVDTGTPNQVETVQTPPPAASTEPASEEPVSETPKVEVENGTTPVQKLDGDDTAPKTQPSRVQPSATETMTPEEKYRRLEEIATEIMKAFDVKAPPVPIESMLQKPPAGLWEQVNISQLTGSFLSIRDPYSPRMSMARLLARHIVASAWGKERNLQELIKTDDDMRAFARMLIIPKAMVLMMTAGARNPVAMSMHFEVPEEDAQKRLLQIAAS